MFQAIHQIPLFLMNFTLCTSLQNMILLVFLCQDHKVNLLKNIDTTLQLGIPSTIANRSQTFTFNFKNIGT